MIDTALREGAAELVRLDAEVLRAFEAAEGRHSDPDYAQALDAYRKKLNEVMGPAWRILEQLHWEDATALESAVTYLESAPRCFRSGYLAEMIMRRLTRATLPNSLRHRVQ